MCFNKYKIICNNNEISKITSLQLSASQEVFVRMSNHRTVLSSPHDKNVFGSLGTVMISYAVPLWQVNLLFKLESDRSRSEYMIIPSPELDTTYK